MLNSANAKLLLDQKVQGSAGNESSDPAETVLDLLKNDIVNLDSD